MYLVFSPFLYYEIVQKLIISCNYLKKLQSTFCGEILIAQGFPFPKLFCNFIQYNKNWGANTTLHKGTVT